MGGIYLRDFQGTRRKASCALHRWTPLLVHLVTIVSGLFVWKVLLSELWGPAGNNKRHVRSVVARFGGMIKPGLKFRLLLLYTDSHVAKFALHISFLPLPAFHASTGCCGTSVALEPL